MPADLAPIAAEICPGEPLDLGIAWAVKVLPDGAVETYESCEGGEGHAHPYPCVRFDGTDAAGWHGPLGGDRPPATRPRSLQDVGGSRMTTRLAILGDAV